VTTLIIGGYILVDVVGRVGFTRPLQGAFEVAQNGVVLAVFFALPYSVLNDELLRIGGFYDAASFRMQKWIHLIGLTLGFIFFVGLVVTNWEPTVNAFRTNEVDGFATIRLPMGPVRGTLLFLWAWAALNVAYLFVRMLRIGPPTTVTEQASTPAGEER
jgi:TRAP-type C4-dicarboxylate transport system permease small subunit